MTIAAKSVPDQDNIVQLKVSWSVYNALVDELGDDSHTRLTYDGETLEIMSPGSKHELIANIISDMIAIELGVVYRPNECWFDNIQDRATRIRG